MISEIVIRTLQDMAGAENVLQGEPMAKHTTFRIGGPADAFVQIESAEALANVLQYLEKIAIPYMILGNGSNLLMDDAGYRGVIIEIADKMNEVRVEGSCLVCQAGALMSKVARVAYENGLTGLAFASGIPGTIGGGCVMNAGAYGGELKQVVESVTVMDRQGNQITLDNESMEFGYRDSVIKHYPYIVVEVRIHLTPGDKEAIKQEMDELAGKRREKQPLEFPSAGSTFKRPEGYFAGELIMNAGLRGYTVGGAQVSEKHCGFVVNKGGATAEDVKALIAHVQETVEEQTGVLLEPEVIIVNS